MSSNSLLTEILLKSPQFQAVSVMIIYIQNALDSLDESV